jgi:hypothetical protein
MILELVTAPHEILRDPVLGLRLRCTAGNVLKLDGVVTQVDRSTTTGKRLLRDPFLELGHKNL